MKNWYEAMIRTILHDLHIVCIHVVCIPQIVTSGDAIQVSGPPNSVQIRNTHIANSLHAFAVVIKEVGITKSLL